MKNLKDLAELDYSLFTSLIPRASKDIKYVGICCFFMEQAIEKLLRHLLKSYGTEASTMCTVPDLAKQLQQVSASSNISIQLCTQAFGITLISWDVAGRYSTDFIPNPADLDQAQVIYDALKQLCDNLDSWGNASTIEERTNKFTAWVSDK